MGNKNFTIINGDSLEVLDTIAENSMDAIITDPPYELGFMGKKWDASGIAYNVTLWEKALRVLKPGGFLLAFGGSRTFHRIACAIEDAGFEIRDTIMWLYGSGFPKSHNVGLDIDKLKGMPNRGHRVATASRYHPDGTFEPNGELLEKYEGKTKEGKQWQGYGTALKPAYEPIIMARKPLEGTVAKNILKYGVGAINIDECRVENTNADNYDLEKRQVSKATGSNDDGHFLDQLHNKEAKHGITNMGRFPANVILTYDETDKDEVCGGLPESNGSTGKPFKATDYEEKETATNFTRGDFMPYNDSGFNGECSAARYFYCAKASKKDRDSGLIKFEEKQVGSLAGGNNDKEELDDVSQRFRTKKKNIHPTVKPVELMQYLVRLVCPKGATILDPFNGSGSTGKAVAFENRERNANYKYIGIELDKEYCKISESRIDYALNKFKYDILEEIKENEEKGQLSLFDF